MKKLALKLGGNVLTKNQMQNISGGDDNPCIPNGCACYCDGEDGVPFFFTCSTNFTSCDGICQINYGRSGVYCTDW